MGKILAKRKEKKKMFGIQFDPKEPLIHCLHCQRIYSTESLKFFKGLPYCKFEDCDGDWIDLNPVSAKDAQNLINDKLAEMVEQLSTSQQTGRKISPPDFSES